MQNSSRCATNTQLKRDRQDQELSHYQSDWAARVQNNGKVTGVFTDYHYYGTGDIGGAPDEESVKRLEAIVTHGNASLPPAGYVPLSREAQPDWPKCRLATVRSMSSPLKPTRCFSTSRPPKAPVCPRTPAKWS